MNTFRRLQFDIFKLTNEWNICLKSEFCRFGCFLEKNL